MLSTRPEKAVGSDEIWEKATSALTDNQVIAYLLALCACLVPWVVGFSLPLIPGSWVPFVQYLTFEYHFSNLSRGLLDTRSLVFYASLTATSLWVAQALLEHRRLS